MPYGRDVLTVTPPPDLEPVELLPAATGEPAGESPVESALRAPDGSPRLEELAGKRSSALVVIPDKTRAAGARVYLPPVLDSLAEGGMGPERVRLITANGSHPRLSKDELAEIVGPEISGSYSIVQHDARDGSAMSYVGRTSRGTPVGVNRLCLDCDLVVLTGSVSFHYFAGFGGGRKTLFPGIGAYDSIVANHRLTLGPGGGLDPRCGPGLLEGNPVHEDLMEAFEMFPPPFLLNTVVAPGGGIVEAFAGAHKPVFEAVCSAARRAYAVKVERKADLVIASCGGHPWDINLLQMHKGLRNACLAARDGGAVVLVGEAAQGVGSATLEQGLNHGDWRAADEAARRSYVLNAHTAVALLQQAARVSIHMVSEARGLSCAQSWARHYPDAQSALEGALESTSVRPGLTYYMPMAGVTVPLPGE